MLNVEVKKKNLQTLREYRDGLFRKPALRYLFLELTMRCNENCLHCGSRCNDVFSEELSPEQYRKFLTQVRDDIGTEKEMLCITGGEPLLRKDFFEIMHSAKDLGFRWGMTSNATLIDDAVANELYKAGMGTISVSIDGLPETHDKFRRTKNGWNRAMNGIEASREIRKLERADASQIPIIAMTANAMSEDKMECIEAGMNAYIPKPINVNDFYKLLDEIVTLK